MPRLYNRIYAKIKGGLDTATGCKGFIARTAMNAKLARVRDTGVVTHGCYDAILFRKKVAALLGGRCKYMFTGSAPINANVLDFMKIAMCCPLMEGYGLTETSGASAVTLPGDP